MCCLLYDFCSSDQRFASSFLQIPYHYGHPCFLAMCLPLQGRTWDFHPLEFAHAGRTKKRQTTRVCLFLACFAQLFQWLFSPYSRHPLPECRPIPLVARCRKTLTPSQFLLSSGLT